MANKTAHNNNYLNTRIYIEQSSVFCEIPLRRRRLLQEINSFKQFKVTLYSFFVVYSGQQYRRKCKSTAAVVRLLEASPQAGRNDDNSAGGGRPEKQTTRCWITSSCHILTPLSAGLWWRLLPLYSAKKEGWIIYSNNTSRADIGSKFK